MADPIIIIGTGLSGYTLGKEFRRYDKETPLLFITADDGRNYSKPMISTGFAKKKPQMSWQWRMLVPWRNSCRLPFARLPK